MRGEQPRRGVRPNQRTEEREKLTETPNINSRAMYVYIIFILFYARKS